MQVVDIAGGRCFDTPRTVSRVLDSLRLFWPRLEGRVDLADLVWLRIVAVANPHTFRWTEEYLDALAAVATGRASIDSRERAATGRRLDEALAADGTDWERVMMEFHLAMPRMSYSIGTKDGQDERVFAHPHEDQTVLSRDRRLPSVDHSRTYFAMARAPGAVDVADIEALILATRDSAAVTIATLAEMAGEANASGATKAERMLDQLRGLPAERLRTGDLRNLALGICSVAARLGDEHAEEWGQPRAWSLATAALAAIRTADPSGWPTLIANVFGSAPETGFLTHVLRDETFNHGLFGDRPRTSDTITSLAEFEIIREALVARYRSLGVAGIIASPRSASMLYAWSQSGLRDEAVAAVQAHVGGEETRLLETAGALMSRTRNGSGRTGSLDPAGLACLFDDVPSLLEQLRILSDGGSEAAATIIAAVESSRSFHNDTMQGWIDRQRRPTEPRDDDGAGDVDEQG